MLSRDFSSASMFRASSDQEQRGSQSISGTHAPSRSGFDEPAEQKRRCASANGRAECVETSDSQGTSLEREDLAGGQIGRTRRRGGKEEDRKPGYRLRHRSEKT